MTQMSIIKLLLPILLATYALALTMTNEPNGIHTFGERADNDRLIYQVDNPGGNKQFFNFKFESPKEGSIITFVEVVVYDIYNETLAYISSGDIGEKSIVVVLGVLHQKEFSFKAAIYGL